MEIIERLELLKQHTHLTWRELAQKAGLANAQTFTDIRAGKHGLSVKVANKLMEAFPEVRREWLLFGDGDMLHKTVDGSIALCDFADGTSLAEEATCPRIDLGSLFKGADLAVRCGSGMAEYPAGAILVLKSMSDTGSIVPGRDYLVETADFAVVRRVQTGSQPGRIALYSTDTAAYPDGRLVHEPFEVDVASVKRTFAVMGCIMTADVLRR